jgi:hypothetical protein
MDHPWLGKFVLVLTATNAVHCGILLWKDGQNVGLENSRNVWRWRGANTLRELATHGAHMTEWTRISQPIGQHEILNAVEIIPCTPEARNNLEHSRWLS